MKRWQRFRIIGVLFLMATCGFIVWVALQELIETWHIVIASLLVLIAFVLTFINRRLEQQAKRPGLNKPVINNN